MFRIFIYRWSYEKNVIISGADISSSVHVDNKEKYILILGEGSTQGLDGTTLTSEAKNSINFTQSNKKLYFTKIISRSTL